MLTKEFKHETAVEDLDTQHYPDSMNLVDTDRIIRLGGWTLGVGFGLFLLWAAFAPLGEGVPTQGTVSIDTKRKEVQHLQGGTVKEVLVREGQYVEQGDVVIRLSDGTAHANYETEKQRYYNLRIMENRLLAEQLGQKEMIVHPDLIEAAKDDPILQQNIEIQRQLLVSRRQSLQSSLSSLEETIKGEQAQVEGYGQIAKTRDSQLRSYQEELARAKNMVIEGYLPRNRQYELERSIADTAGYKADALLNQARARQSILDMKQRMITTQADYNKEVETQLSEVRRDVEPEAEKLKVAIKDLEATKIKAPVSGQVVGLNVQTVGAVIQGGQKLMDIVPLDERLMLETQIPPHLIDRVKAGDPVDVRFSTFSHTPQLVVEGKIDSISSDVVIEKDSQTPPYYLARISLTPEGLKTLGSRQLQPGMPVDVVVKTGSRTLLTYILHPLIKRFASAMTEE